MTSLENSIRTSKVFDWNASATTRYRINQGGTSSSKTFSILQLLYYIATYSSRSLLISVVSETMPHLRKGAMRDFFSILGTAYDADNHNKTENTYKVGKSLIEFFSADTKDKVHGPRRDILFINEANHISEEIFTQLDIRTRMLVFIDFNPTNAFWATEMQGDPDVSYFISTYRDNPFLDDRIKQVIEKRRSNEMWWRVYGEGQIGQVEGLVFTNWEIIDAFPEGEPFYGLDWGYTNDPNALIKQLLIDQTKLYLQEMIYEPGLTNQQLSRRLEMIGVKKGYDEIYGDSAEPKSIQEIANEGWLIYPAIKGPDSVLNGIQKMHNLTMYVTKDSVNLIKELRNYTWLKDKDGRYINKPIDDFNHALDAIRYGYTTKYGIQSLVM